MEPINASHPLGHNLGDFLDYSGVYQHSGIDILATPADSSMSSSAEPPEGAPWVVATVAGAMTCQDDGETSLSNKCEVVGAGGVVYRYLHLYFGNLPPGSRINLANARHVSAGDRIAQVVTFVPGEYSHLHYELQKNDYFGNPLRDIVPHDSAPPTVAAVGFAIERTDLDIDPPWQEITLTVGDEPPGTALPLGCESSDLLLHGQVDIVVRAFGEDNAGATSQCALNSDVGVHHVSWVVCPGGTPDCSNWKSTRPFDTMPAAWTSPYVNNVSSRTQFSKRSPWVSKVEYCVKKPVFGVISDWVDLWPSTNGTLDTSTLPNGRYVVRVQATDFSMHTSPMFDKWVCIMN